MSDITDIFARQSVLLIFTYAPVGFGHLRVSDALYRGLPSTVSPILLGAQDKSITILYRLLSVNPILTRLMERSQRGVFEGLYALTSRWFYRMNTKTLLQQLETIIDERLDVPDTVLIVSTHFALAHQIAAIKEKLSEKKHVRVILVVQVTDDSPQQIWYINGSDITFVPSQDTKRALENYGKKSGFAAVNFVVNPYPINPLLARRLTDEKIEKRKKQVEKEHRATTHIAIPLSGAAVGLDFFKVFIDALHLKSNHYYFHIVGKEAPYTRNFFASITSRNYVTTYMAYTDRIVIDAHAQLYQREVIAIEITKPSEQAFKTLLHPTQVGGALIFFTKPVGRQEYDNINFLLRHNLIPTQAQCEILWEKARKNESISASNNPDLFGKARHWRGLLLPVDAKLTAVFIDWVIKQRIAEVMMQHTKYMDMLDPLKEEVKDNGVSSFWEKTAEYLKERMG